MSIVIKGRSLEKPVPHPILDDPSKMMRIIANPLYDKLTVSRAASMRKITTPQSIPQTSKLNRSKEKQLDISSINSNNERTTIILKTPDSITNSQQQSTLSLNRQNVPPFHLPVPPPSRRKSSRAVSSTPRSRATTSKSTAQSLQSALAEDNSSLKKPVPDGTIRYVNTRHGFEVQRYISSNWLSTDVYTKDACQSHEKTFRDMLDKKRQIERLSRSIYSSEYYKKRWDESLGSYKQGFLTHREWAKQNYELFCLKKLYAQAKKREQNDIDLDSQDVRRTRALNAYKEWKYSKDGDNATNYSRSTTARSRPRTEGTSNQTNNLDSLPAPVMKATNENNMTVNEKTRRLSASTSGDSELQRLSAYQSNTTSTDVSTISSSTLSYIYDRERWSLQAMVKRVVGLNEPLSNSSKDLNQKQPTATNTSLDSGFESTT